MAEDPGIVQYDVHEHGAEIDEHHHPGLSLPTVESRHGVRNQHRCGTKAEDAKVDDFPRPDARCVPCRGED